MKKRFPLFLCVALLLSMAAPVYAAEPPQEAQTAGAYLVERDILQGNATGDLMLEKGLNRAELAAILTRLCGNPEHIAADQAYYTRQCTFTDVPEWAKLYVGFCAANGYVTGYGNGLFGAADSVNPAAASTVILRYLEYTDSAWDYATAATKAQELGLLPASAANDAAITRGDMAILIYRAMGNSGNSQETQVPEPPATTAPPAVGPISKNADGSLNLPSDGSQYIPKDGDVIRCDDGTNYTITNARRYGTSMFDHDPTGALPEPTCDWSSFPAVELPPMEVRRFNDKDGDYIFIRNLYESRRMQYLLQNLAGNHPETSENGKLRYGSKGTPSVRISLEIDDDLPYQSFWPWRESELTNLFNSVPPGTYDMEVWDVFKNGVFVRTEYQVRST